MAKIYTFPATVQKWQQASVSVSIFTTALDALANSTSEGTGKALGAAISNDANKDTYADFVLALTYAVAATAGGYVEIALLPSINGSNYADGSTTVDPDPQLWVGRFGVRAVNTAQRLVVRGVLLPPFKFKVLLRNKGGQAFGASGHTLDMKTYNLEVV